jgi:superfamily II DNA/RNA helicase
LKYLLQLILLMKFLPSVTVMSIGTVKDIDIADIDWVFQFNAPSCASDFIHRCGRTARIGNRGTTLAFLQPVEEPYVHFIDINQNKVTENSIVLSPLSN